MWEPVLKEDENDENSRELVPTVAELQTIYGIKESEWGDGWPTDNLTLSNVPRGMIRSVRTVEYERVEKKDNAVEDKDKVQKQGEGAGAVTGKWVIGPYLRGAID